MQHQGLGSTARRQIDTTHGAHASRAHASKTDPAGVRGDKPLASGQRRKGSDRLRLFLADDT
jgi:hypothetical protein